MSAVIQNSGKSVPVLTTLTTKTVSVYPVGVSLASPCNPYLPSFPYAALRRWLCVLWTHLKTALNSTPIYKRKLSFCLFSYVTALELSWWFSAELSPICLPCTLYSRCHLSSANKRLNVFSWMAHCASMNTMWFAVTLHSCSWEVPFWSLLHLISSTTPGVFCTYLCSQPCFCGTAT